MIVYCSHAIIYANFFNKKKFLRWMSCHTAAMTSTAVCRGSSTPQHKHKQPGDDDDSVHPQRQFPVSTNLCERPPRHSAVCCVHCLSEMVLSLL